MEYLNQTSGHKLQRSLWKLESNGSNQKADKHYENH